MKRTQIMAIAGAVAAIGIIALYATTTRVDTAKDNVAKASPAMPGEALVRVTVPNLTEDERIGEAAFNARCAQCHGPNAAGRNGVAPPLVHKIYEPGHHADMAFFMAAQNGVRAHHWPFGDMPPVPGITRAEIASIVAYVRALQRANGIE
ncbi:cytochrome c [Albidovulum inexpectatum]|uniref:Cytochrome c n=1 Tax=Albidovulum inexpectatum TaxID=196587 RepID=A0A2S5JJB4_9RHOB|nr:c-type cytochrome [Albidovulum inexpectatum]PPB81594.1 cytochrome c [Albidovulum inexpectatum]